MLADSEVLKANLCVEEVTGIEIGIELFSVVF